MFKSISISIKAKNMKLPEELIRLASDFSSLQKRVQKNGTTTGFEGKNLLSKYFHFTSFLSMYEVMIKTFSDMQEF